MRLWLWCMTPHLTIFQLYRDGQFGGGNRSTRRKLTNLSHIVVSSTPRLSGIRTHNISADSHLLHTEL